MLLPYRHLRQPSCDLPSSPEEHPFERVEEGPCILELRQETLLIPIQEARPELGRESAFVVREHAPPYPLNDRLPRLQLMGVDLQTDVLLLEPQAVQERRVHLRRQHRR